MNRTTIVVSTAAAVVLIACGGAWAGTIEIQTLAFSGEQADGLPEGVQFSYFSVPSISSGGQVAFAATVAGPGITEDNDRGIWVGPPGGLVLAAREGDSPAGMPTEVYPQLEPFAVAVNSAGLVAFYDSVGPEMRGGPPISLWAGPPDDARLAAREGEQAAAMAIGFDYAYFPEFTPVYNDVGHVTFHAAITDGVTTTDGFGVWSGPPEALSLVVRIGDPAPNAGEDILFDRIREMPLLNSTGQFLFSSFLSGPGVTFANDTAVWFGSPAGSVLVAREGDPADGVGPGIHYDEMFAKSLSAAGFVAFTATLEGSGVGSGNERGAWAGATDNPILVARQDDPAANVPAGVKYNYLNRILVNQAGQVLVNASLKGTGVDNDNNSAIWVGTPGNFQMIAREDDHAPGTPSDVRFSGISVGLLNGLGQTVFLNNLRGNVTSADDWALYGTDVSGRLCLLGREGDEFEVAPGVSRTVVSLYLLSSKGNGEDGRPTPFSGAGQAAFMATFDDGSRGIFVATIPNPQCAGDTNGDGFVDGRDLDNFVTCVLSGSCCGGTDMDNDGETAEVDMTDDLSAFVDKLLEDTNTGCP